MRAPQSADTGWGWGGRTWSTRVYTATRSPMYATCPRAPAAAAAQGGQRHDHSPPSNLQGGFKHSGAQRIPSETLGGTYGRKAWDRMGRRIRVPPGAPDPHPLLHTGPGRKSSFWNASGHRGRVVATTVAPRGVARADRCLGFCTFGGADLAMVVLETSKRKISREIKDSFEKSLWSATCSGAHWDHTARGAAPLSRSQSGSGRGSQQRLKRRMPSRPASRRCVSIRERGTGPPKGPHTPCGGEGEGGGRGGGRRGVPLDRPRRALGGGRSTHPLPLPGSSKSCSLERSPC